MDKYVDQDLPLEGLPERTPKVDIDYDRWFRLMEPVKWVSEPSCDGWYLFRFSHSDPTEIVRVVKCRILAKLDKPYNLGFSVEHEAIGCVHKDQRQKEFLLAGPLNFINALKSE